MSPQADPNSLEAQRSYLGSKLFGWLCALATALCIAALVWLLVDVLMNGLPWLSWTLLTSYPSRDPAKAGILPALMGSLWLIGLTALFSIPTGVGAAVYLEEYVASSWWKKLVQLNISNLAGVPSIVYGILGLGLFVRGMALERSVIAGALTLSLVVLPIVILSTQEALRAVPGTIRQASYALGATRWQTVWSQVLPAALPGVMTGVILAIARALGEAAPLVAIGAVAFVAFVPQSLSDEFSAMPLQIFNWAERPQEEFHGLASAAIVVLLAVLIVLNTGAVLVRAKYGRRIKW
ncbi:phosphate ABC transporter permease PstA [Botrimarina mediterranea]|uniref:Phosphate transport system permease protein PstA n=1 Tax=Botrimarina mediterranea TaxID=2528022 RepID=A0A518KDD4_9BACT|nr:phosphate ABC transporter permease PstA [Botrimarina mediterranea]QDV75769.1 Phosphate transport system permease protein PstA [Botrimarina mediterranea]QDV80367.1 Phosphate transport system permease protein PstA [Planctomycetes bacterium K2D]